MTKDPDTKEFIMITQFAEKGNLRSFLSTHFNKTLWKDKLNLLFKLISDLEHLHNLGYFHKDFHSGNILQIDDWSYISDFGLSGSSNEPKSDIKICGVLPYIAPEVLDREPYTVSSDIYSFGVIMAELSSGKPPFHERKHDHDLSLEICNGLRPKFGKGTPKIYEKLAKKCMDARPYQRPTAKGLWKILNFWHECTEYNNYQDCKGKDIEDFFEEFEFGFKGKDIKNTLKDIKDLFEEFDHKGKEIKAMFEEADKEIPNISTSYEKNPDAIYSSRILTFMPNDDENDDKDSKIHNLDINVTSCEKNPDATCTSKISTPKPIFSNIIKSNDDKFNKEADDINKILNISSLYEKIPDATCTSKISTLSNLPKPISSNIIESNDDENNDEVIDSPDSEITNLDIADYNLP
ncbi:kinase-like domain-containing protein [Rhizophagus diaphanus]|nr:kinase-like domain-containing protein [Rhizophagus diaphanus] [Rhizophagus sp. MUCL 43196]